MTTDDLDLAFRLVSRQRPFRNYFIEFLSGDRLLVSHPEAVARRGLLFLFRSPALEYRVFTASSVCQVLLPPPGSA